MELYQSFWFDIISLAPSITIKLFWGHNWITGYTLSIMEDIKSTVGPINMRSLGNGTQAQNQSASFILHICSKVSIMLHPIRSTQLFLTRYWVSTLLINIQLWRCFSVMNAWTKGSVGNKPSSSQRDSFKIYLISSRTHKLAQGLYLFVILQLPTRDSKKNLVEMNIFDYIKLSICPIKSN